MVKHKSKSNKKKESKTNKKVKKDDGKLIISEFSSYFKEYCEKVGVVINARVRLYSELDVIVKVEWNWNIPVAFVHLRKDYGKLSENAKRFLALHEAIHVFCFYNNCEMNEIGINRLSILLFEKFHPEVNVIDVIEEITDHIATNSEIDSVKALVNLIKENKLC